MPLRPSLPSYLTRACARLLPDPGATPAHPRQLDELLDQALAAELDGSAPPAPGGLELAPWRGQPGLAGEVFQELQKRRNPLAARDGQVFTPWPLARRLVELLEPAADQRWLDPAAGAGIFLQAAAAAGVRATACQALELDPAAAALGGRLTPGCAWRVGDALADWSALPADWRGGFDRVILNPPFRNGVERRDPAWSARRAELRARFATTRGPFDLYVPFVERGLEFLRPGGQLGLLLPNTWLASRYGQALRLWLAQRTRLLRLQHAPGLRLFPRADFEALLLVVELRADGAGGALQVERLERRLDVVERHACPPALVTELAAEGWGPLLQPPGLRRLHALTRPLGEQHEVRASLSADEFYRLEVRECPGLVPEPAEVRLLSSGALEPFRHTWADTAVRFRGARRQRPVVRLADLSPGRRNQARQPRVLLANLSRRLEALAVAPGAALGVVNVMQVFCRDQAEARALAAWLNSGPVQAWVHTWHDPLRMNGQLSLNRELVRSLPGPPRLDQPGQAADAEQLRRLGRLLAELADAGRLDQAGEGLRQLDELAARWLPAAAGAAPEC
ncbi:MAG: N-6 DNA methylase [Candidatus Delongbacteria bacterium]